MQCTDDQTSSILSFWTDHADLLLCDTFLYFPTCNQSTARFAHLMNHMRRIYDQTVVELQVSIHSWPAVALSVCTRAHHRKSKNCLRVSHRTTRRLSYRSCRLKSTVHPSCRSVEVYFQLSLANVVNCLYTLGTLIDASFRDRLQIVVH